MLWLLFYTNFKTKQYITNFNWLSFEKKTLIKILKLGFPSALQMFFEVALFTSGIWLSGVLGKNAQASNQIALNLSSMTYMIGVGLSVAAMVRVGNQKGLKDYINLKRIAISIFLLTFIIEVVFALFFILFREWLPTVYLDKNNVLSLSDTTEVITTASQLLLIAAFFQISDGFQIVFLGALRGLQDVVVPTVLLFIAYWLVAFPISYYLGLKTTLKSMGIWIGLLAGLSLSAVFCYLRFWYLTRKLIVAHNVANEL